MLTWMKMAHSSIYGVTLPKIAADECKVVFELNLNFEPLCIYYTMYCVYDVVYCACIGRELNAQCVKKACYMSIESS